MSEMMPSDLLQYVQMKVKCGEFSSESEFTMEAIRLYRDVEMRHQELKATIKERIRQADSGEVEPLDIEAIKTELFDTHAADSDLGHG